MKKITKEIIKESKETEDIFEFEIELDFSDFEDELGDELEDESEIKERARPPRLKARQRKANKVKSAVTRDLLGYDSPLRPLIDKIFKKIERAVKKEASKQNVPLSNINLKKLTIKK